MLHAFYKAVSCNVFDNVALIVNPFNALTDVECVCETVFGNFIRLSKCGSLNVFNVVLKKSVVSVYDSFGVSSLRCCKCVPCRRIGCVSESIYVVELVAFTCKVALCPSFICACALELCPFSLHLIASSGCERIALDDDSLMESVGVVAPEHGCDRIGSNSGYSIVTAL